MDQAPFGNNCYTWHTGKRVKAVNHRWVHLVLVIVMLVQPVAIFAAASVPLVPNADAPESSMIHHDTGVARAFQARMNCHDQPDTTPQNDHDCCDNMASAACLLSCASIVCAPVGFFGLSNPIYTPAHRVWLNLVHPHYTPSGLFRPPRIRQGASEQV